MAGRGARDSCANVVSQPESGHLVNEMLLVGGMERPEDLCCAGRFEHHVALCQVKADHSPESCIHGDEASGVGTVPGRAEHSIPPLQTSALSLVQSQRPAAPHVACAGTGAS